LRGAGNLLGGEQHGHIEAVGYDTYIRLLEETVQELKGEEVPLEIHATLNLGLDIRIPADYIREEAQRLRAYKRIADLHTEEQAKKVLDEFGDRYGAVPAEVKNLIRFSLLKSLAERVGAETIDRRQGFANIKFHSQSRIDPFRLMEMVKQTPGAQFTPAGVLKVPMDAQQPAVLISELQTHLMQLQSAEVAT
jgi:transcription-repair coupling factor (superfamily II helicase)